MDALPIEAAPLPIVVVGHVDHGKSTLIGRLLHDTGALPEARIAQLRALASRRGLEMEFSFLLDSLQVERDQGITVDTAQIWFRSALRRYVIIDAPGHVEFLRNMVTGAAAADAAILVVDAQAGVSEQTRRHGYLLGILGVRQVVVAVNKVDLIGRDPARFAAVAEEVRAYLGGIGIAPSAIIPLSARHGDNIVERSAEIGWYEGPSLLQALDRLSARPGLEDGALRLPVQDLYRVEDRRVVVGRIESGRLSVGQSVRFAPSGQVATIAAIESWGAARPPLHAAAGQSVALTFDREVFVERGHLVTHDDAAPADSHALTVRLFWLDRVPLREGDRLSLRYGTAERQVAVEAIEAVIDVEAPSDGLAGEAAGDALGQKHVLQNGIARVRLRARRAMSLDAYDEAPRTGRGVLVRNHRVAGGFVVESLHATGADLTAVDAPVTPAERALGNGHHGGVLWLTGLSGAGKSTLAMALLRRLHADGRQATVLDGDQVRQGLNRDLGFSPEDRTENVRRVAEVAKLMSEAGLIVIVSLISPLVTDRAQARRIVGPGFQEVFVKAGLEACEARDPKGLYRRARARALPSFTGISAPYEPPAAPALVVDTEALTPQEGVQLLLEHAERVFSAAA